MYIYKLFDFKDKKKSLNIFAGNLKSSVGKKIEMSPSGKKIYKWHNRILKSVTESSRVENNEIARNVFFFHLWALSTCMLSSQDFC